MDCSLPGSSVHGIFQARVLEWVTISFSRIFIFIYLFSCDILYLVPNQGSNPGPQHWELSLRHWATRGVKGKWKSLCWVRSLQPHGIWNSPTQKTGVGGLSLLQGIFPIPRSNPGLPHCRQILYQLSHKGSSNWHRTEQIVKWLLNKWRISICKSKGSLKVCTRQRRTAPKESWGNRICQDSLQRGTGPKHPWHRNSKMKSGDVLIHLTVFMLVLSHVRLCNPMGYRLPGASVCGIFQAKILEWIAMPSSRESSQPRDWTHISCVLCIAGRFFSTELPGPTMCQALFKSIHHSEQVR